MNAPRISLTAFSIWRGFYMSGRKILDRTTHLIFPHYLIKVTIFEKYQVDSIFSETFLILRITELDVIKNAYLSSCKVPVILVRF